MEEGEPTANSAAASNNSTDGAETITDIQNYLASFNKEIQDGTTSGSTSHAALENAEGENSSHVAGSSSTTTYYVAQSADGAAVEGYQYNQSDGQYGTTYYASSDGTYYTAASGDQGGQDTIAAYAAQGATVVPVAGTTGTYQAGEHGGLQQIVLAVSERGTTSDAADAKRSEIVAIPAAVAQGGAVQGEPATFVTMQPGASSDNHIDSGQDGQQQSDVAHGLAPTHTIRMVLRQSDGTEIEQNIPLSTPRVSTILTGDGQEIHVSDEGTLQMMATIAEQAAAGSLGDGNNQVLLNMGNTYQAVTVVPSGDASSGEVNYMLIVQQSDDDKDGGKDLDLDMSVYDFNEGEKNAHGEVVTEEVAADGTKTRTIRITQKKSQIVTQAHMCNYCNYTSPKRYLLSRHMKSHSEERPHKCGVCERGFKTLAALQNHVNTHTGTRPHCCRDCDASFTTSGELVRHVRYRHTHEKPHRCTECDYASVELSKLKRHMRCHTGERPYQCPHCTYASPDMYKLKRHLRIHTGEKPYECDVCQARFTQSNSLKAHKLIHSGNKPAFHCEFCPTTCGRKTDLRIHMQKLHTSDKPLKCKRCGKTFPDRYSYKLHSKTHEGEKCFKCDLCPYASISQRHLESHMLIHTDQKPFRCDECDQAFRQKQLLRRHKNLYHDPHYVPPVPKEKTNECSECGKAFRHKGNLIRHLAIHDPDASENDKADALRIGAPKAPGELPDGEEEDDDDAEDEDEVDLDCSEFPQTLSFQATEVQEGQGAENQVVVFEVIQLHSQEARAATMSDEDGLAIANGGGGELTVLREVADEQCFANAIDQQILQEEAEDMPAPVVPRRRGRPRKNPLPESPKPSSKALEIIEEIVTPRQLKKRKMLVEEDELTMSETIETPPPEKKGRMTRSSRLKKEEPSTPQKETNDAEADAMEFSNREAELARRRLQQKEKDMAECFGFNDDEEEEETILAMPTVPGTQGIAGLEENSREPAEGSLLNHSGTLAQLT